MCIRDRCLTSDFNEVYVNETKTEGGRAAEAAVVYLDVPRSVLDCSAFTQKAYSDIGLSLIHIWYLFGGSDNSGANTGAVSRKRNEYGAVIYIVYA